MCFLPASPGASAAVGVTAGSAGVSSTGSANYSIPLVLPPGTNGLTPSLSLQYSSTAGNGLVGVGWGIGGLSGISRCDKTVAQDGATVGAVLAVSDGYCLDGNRLRLTGGTYGTTGSTYQTEIETFSKVTAQGTAGNGPAWWEVRGKDGLIYEYGNTTDSRIETVNSTTARFWALNKIKDRAGNYIDFVYIEDTTNGSFRPSEIRYTGNSTVGTSPATKVVFVYETVNRTDPIYKYHYGIVGTSIEGQINEFKRLDKIDVINIGSATTVRTYDLTYEASGGAGGRSRLSSIQECKGADCLAATSLTWINGTSSWASTETSTGVTIPTGATTMLGDINGDGRDDIVYSSSATSGAGTWYYMLGTATGLGAATNTTLTNWNQANAQQIEFNGDGLMDILVPCNGASTWCVLQSTGTGFTSINTGTPATGYAGLVLAADVDGDGRDDLLRIAPPGGSLQLRLRTGAGFAATESAAWTAPQFDNIRISGNFNYTINLKRNLSKHRIDINGDGREDFFLELVLDDPEPGTPDFFWEQTFYGVGATVSEGESGGYPNAIGDFNGDGLSDALYWGPSMSAQLGQGTSLSNTIPGPSTTGLQLGFLLVADYDGDGLDDIIVGKTSTGTWNVARSTGNGFAALVDTGLSLGTAGVGVADVNGDGLADILKFGAVKFRLHNGVYPDLLDRVTDGFGMYVDFNYTSLTAGGSTYTKGSGAVFPTIEYQGPMYVVSSYTATDGNLSTYTMTYSYQQARQHLQGRGFLGFLKRISADSRTSGGVSARVEETYLQDPVEYQAIGAPSLVQVKQSSGTLISEVTNTWNKTTYSSGFTERRFPYISTQVAKRYEAGGTYNGSLISTATTTNTVDSTSGTIYDSTTSTVEASTANGLQSLDSYSARVYHPQVNLLNDTTNWCIGRPGQTQFINSHTEFGGTSVTRTANRTWDGVKCRVTQEVTEPGSAQWQVTRDIGYDNWGNLNSDSITGVGMTARVTQASYAATNGRFLSSVTNALSQTTTYGWDQNIGLPTSVQDPNSLSISWQYDNFGRRTREDRPAGASTTTATTWSYTLCTSGCDSRVRMYISEQPRDTSNNVVRTNVFYFDQANRLIYEYRQMLDANYSITKRNFDSLGRVSRQYLPYLQGAASTYYSTPTYDILNRVTQVSRPVSDSDATLETTSTFYEGLTTRVVDALTKQRTLVRNVRGEVIRSTDHSGNYQNFDFDAFGNQLRVVDNLTNTLQSGTYNVRGMRTASTDMDLGSWSFTPDALGELVSQTDAKTQNTTFVYDLLGRLKTRTEAEGTSTWTWGTTAASHNIGQLASLSGPGYSESYTYDSVGRLSNKSIVSDATYAIDYAYNTQGLIDTLTYPTSTSSYRLKLQYVYQYGLLTAVKDFNALTTVFWQATAGDARGNVIDETLGNGLRTIRGIDQVTNLVDSLTTGPGGGTSIQNLVYSWDKVGNLTQRQDLRQSLTEAFFYDDLYRLDYSTLNGTTNLDLAYDGLGNITAKTSATDPSINVGSYTYHATKKHAVTAAGSYSFGYDANGNVTTRNGSTITWYSYNLPNTINASGSNSSQFFYTPTRERWKQVASYGGTAETTIYIGGLIEKVTLGTVTSWKHVIAAGSSVAAIYTRKDDATNQIHYVTHDHLGSIDSISDGSGAVEVRVSFASFGQRRNDAGWSGNPTSSDWAQITATSRRGYTSHEMLDNLNLTHMNGRVYDQVIGRFLSPDPLIPDRTSTQSFNRYSYTQNRVLSSTDPSGFNDKSDLPKRTASQNGVQDSRGSNFDRSNSGGLWDFATGQGMGMGDYSIGTGWTQATTTYSDGTTITSSKKEDWYVQVNNTYDVRDAFDSLSRPDGTRGEGGGRVEGGEGDGSVAVRRPEKNEEQKQNPSDPPDSSSPCSAVAKWLFNNVSIEGGTSVGMGPGVSGSLNANFSEISGDVTLGAMIIGVETHVGVNFQLTGPGLREGLYGLTQVCYGVRGAGACASFASQAGRTNISIMVGTVQGYSAVNGLAYHKPVLGPAPMPSGVCEK